MFAVQILMKAVVIAWSVLQQQRRWLGLPGIMTSLDEVGMLSRIADVQAHCCVPTIGDGCKARIEGRPELGNHLRQRIAEILVLAASKAVPRHDDAAAKKAIVGIKRNQGLTLVRREQVF